MNTVLQYNLKSVRAYLLKEEFQVFWDYISPYWAEKYLDRWCIRGHEVKDRTNEENGQNGSTAQAAYLELIQGKKKAYSSGIVKGLNTKIKLTTRKSY